MTKNDLIEEIIYMEWKMMISITAIDDPDGCRQDPATFQIMRKSQHLIWSEDTLTSYLADLQLAESQQVNMAAERYAHMMKTTYPAEYELIKNDLRPVTAEAVQLVEKIMEIFSGWGAEVDRALPQYQVIWASSHRKWYLDLGGHLSTWRITDLFSINPVIMSSGYLPGAGTVNQS